MASTNKTTNIGLNQFVASDKPAWLTDYNNDMRAIDEAVGAMEVAQQELGQQVTAQREDMDGLEARMDGALEDKANHMDWVILWEGNTGAGGVIPLGADYTKYQIYRIYFAWPGTTTLRTYNLASFNETSFIATAYSIGGAAASPMTVYCSGRIDANGNLSIDACSYFTSTIGGANTVTAGVKVLRIDGYGEVA